MTKPRESTLWVLGFQGDYFDIELRPDGLATVKIDPTSPSQSTGKVPEERILNLVFPGKEPRGKFIEEPYPITIPDRLANKIRRVAKIDDAVENRAARGSIDDALLALFLSQVLPKMRRSEGDDSHPRPDDRRRHRLLGGRHGVYLRSMNNVGCRPFNAEETDRLLNTNKGRYFVRDRALFTLGIYTGLRIGEMLSLTLQDVLQGDEVKKVVTVKAQYVKGGRQKRTLPLHETARAALKEWILAMRVRGLISPLQALFPRQLQLQPMTRHQARRLILAACVEAGIPLDRIGSHSLRKRFAMRLWESPYVAKDMARMARLLGHTNWNNTLRYLQFDDLEAAILA